MRQQKSFAPSFGAVKEEPPKSAASFPMPKTEARFGQFLVTSKASHARRRGATTEVYEAIRRKPVESFKVEREERAKATPQMMP